MTNKQTTFNTLDSYFLNTGNGRLNVGYLNDCVYDMLNITYRQTNAGNGENLLTVLLKNKRRKTAALVWAAFCEMTNNYIEFMECKSGIVCTSEQLKKYLAQYGYTPETALCLVCEEVEKMRREYTK